MRDITGHNFVIEITRPEVIKEARDIVKSGAPKIVIGRIIKRTAFYNPQWDFHYNPDTISFADAAIEVCDATIPLRRGPPGRSLSGPFLPGLYWCPWTGRLTAEVTPANPFSMPSSSNGDS
ncbi:calmodulin-binding protein [Streptomyces sp. S1D4-11]